MIEETNKYCIRFGNIDECLFESEVQAHNFDEAYQKLKADYFCEIQDWMEENGEYTCKIEIGRIYTTYPSFNIDSYLEFDNYEDYEYIHDSTYDRFLDEARSVLYSGRKYGVDEKYNEEANKLIIQYLKDKGLDTGIEIIKDIKSYTINKILI